MGDGAGEPGRDQRHAGRGSSRRSTRSWRRCGRPAAHRPAFDRLELKFSTAGAEHFDRLKIKLKREIITFGQHPGSRTAKSAGPWAPQEWNRLIDDPDVLVLDTRNGFEVEMGTFANAVDPKLTSFSQFKTYVDRELGARQGPENRDVLHRRDPLREGQRLYDRGRVFRGVPAAGRDSALSGGDPGSARASGAATASCSTSGSRSAMGWP